ncbi:UNVERIFIED_CONTAM: hypothetical protein BEN50_11075 [Euhalothece sp. KZN 001]
MTNTITKTLVANPFSTKEEIESAKKYALNYKQNKSVLISHDGNCPKCQSKDEDTIIPGLDAVYCYHCQKSYPTEYGCSYGWGWTYEDYAKAKKDKNKRDKQRR